MKIFLSECRHGDEKYATLPHREGWDRLIKELEKCNGLSFEEARKNDWEVEGSFEEGFLSMDEGGSIETIEILDLDSNY